MTHSSRIDYFSPLRLEVKPQNEIMIEKFGIPYPTYASEKKRWCKEYGLNAYYAGKHWAVRKRDAEFWHWLTMSNMNSQGVRRDPFKGPVSITFRWNDRLDCSNHAAIGKMIEDAMKGRVIQDDSRKYVAEIRHCFHDEDYIGVEIKEV